MAAQHHEAGIRIAAWDFRREVERIRRFGELSGDIELQRDGDVLLQQPHHSVVMFVGHEHRWRRQLVVGSGSRRRPAAHYGAAVGPVARRDHHQHALIF